MHSDSASCVQCKSLKDEKIDIDMIKVDEEGDMTCSCPVCKCQCQIVFKQGDCSKIMLARHLEGLHE